MSKNRTWLSHGMLYEFKGWLELRWYRLTVKRLRLIHTIDVLMEK